MFEAILTEATDRFPHATDGDLAEYAFLTASEPNPALPGWLARHGVDYETIEPLIGPLAVHGVLTSGRHFLPVSREEGRAAVVWTVRDDDLRAIDLIAWRPDEPVRWSLFYDAAGLLGSDNAVNPASYSAGPLPVRASVHAWLQAGASGVCILNPARARATLRKAAGPIAATDERHALRLAHDLAPDVSPEKIWFAKDARRAA
jgi:hypothetical protein